MEIKKECIAMLLAGGQGSRLCALTCELAKPAVPFGGKYRIIDFPLSNCVNSGIDTVGVLTQYEPLVLNEYIGSGQPWGLDRLSGGVFILPPYRRSAGSDWYTGTANAVFQNISFIDRYSPDFVLILSGDHIYKMDYAQMLLHHKNTGADCTIAVFDVPLSEAPRFGIMTTRPDTSVISFEEKPQNPSSTLASMGVYIFNRDVLKSFLLLDSADPDSDNDFGKNIIPKMLACQKRLFTFSFDGYWKDVGTIDSLWRANMDLLEPSMPLGLYEPDRKIYSRNHRMPPHFIGRSAQIQNSIISEGSEISGSVLHSVISYGVSISEGASVIDSIVMPGAKIGLNASVSRSIVAENAVVGDNARVGGSLSDTDDSPDMKITVIGPGACVPEGAFVPPASVFSICEKEGEI